jgi:hypothetical protein
MEHSLPKHIPTNIQNIIQNGQHLLALIALQESKPTATKSTKYLQRTFPDYKLIFNHTHNATICSKRRELNYAPLRGGLMTLIHKNYSFLRNIQKIATHNKISPYLQTIEIQNKPLKPLIIITLYMATHQEDLTLVSIIKNTIHTTLNIYQSHTIILLRDFNRDIKLNRKKQKPNMDST